MDFDCHRVGEPGGELIVRYQLRPVDPSLCLPLELYASAGGVAIRGRAGLFTTDQVKEICNVLRAAAATSLQIRGGERLEHIPLC